MSDKEIKPEGKPITLKFNDHTQKYGVFAFAQMLGDNIWGRFFTDAELAERDRWFFEQALLRYSSEGVGDAWEDYERAKEKI